MSVQKTKQKQKTQKLLQVQTVLNSFKQLTILCHTPETTFANAGINLRLVNVKP